MNPSSIGPKGPPTAHNEQTLAHLLGRVFQDIGRDPAAYIWAGVPASVLSTFLLVWSMLLGVGYAGLILVNSGETDTATDLWFVVVIYGQFACLLPLLFCAEIWTYRVIWMQLSGKKSIGLKSVLTAVKISPFQTLVFSVVSTVFLMVSILLCCIPVLFYSLLRPLAVCLFIVEGLGPLRAYIGAVREFKDDFSYQFKTVGMGVLLNLSLSGIPVLGPALGYALSGAVHLKGYQERKALR